MDADQLELQSYIYMTLDFNGEFAEFPKSSINRTLILVSTPTLQLEENSVIELEERDWP